MDEGRIQGTDAIWPADQIWQLGDAATIDWRCVGCEAKLTPRAWRTGIEYRKAANFAALDGHEPGCTADGLERLIADGGRKTIKTADGLPGPYPAAVSFVHRRESRAEEGQPAEGVRDIYRYARGGGERPQNPDHRRTVTTIRQVCRFYRAFPGLKHLSLRIDDCAGNTYFDIFRPLSNNDSGPVERKILYAGIRFKEILEDSAATLRIPLNLTNATVVDGKRVVERVHLSVDWSGWSEMQRGLFRNHVTEIRDELADKYKKAKQGNPPSAIVYFIGRRIGAHEFLADDHRKVCLLAA